MVLLMISYKAARIFQNLNRLMKAYKLETLRFFLVILNLKPRRLFGNIKVSVRGRDESTQRRAESDLLNGRWRFV